MYTGVVVNLDQVAEGVGFEPTRPFSLVIFETTALDQLCDPSMQAVIYHVANADANIFTARMPYATTADEAPCELCRSR